MQTNPYTLSLLGGQVTGMAVEEIFLHFDQAPIDIAMLRLQPDEPRLLTVATAAGLPESLLFHFIPAGTDTLIVGTIDIAETRRLHRELLDLNRQFTELTRELQKKNHQLAELNQLKNQFLGMAAHDLRKPVSAILGYSEFLLDEAAPVLSDEHLGFLRIIHSSTSFMRRLIDDFLDYAHIESGRFAIHPQPADMEKLVARSLRLHALPARKRGIRLHLQHRGESATLRMDENKIEQVINNFLVNALEHSPEDAEVMIEIDSGADEVQVAVADNGPGLDPEKRDRLFTSYMHAEARLTAGAKSSGLGLVIAKKIIDAHAGKIWVESETGKGARFCFILPKNLPVEGDRQ